MINLSVEEYNRADGMRSSYLRHLLKSPAHYRHATNFPFTATPAMELGTAVHTAILEPDRFKYDYVISKKFDRRTTKGKQDHFVFKERNLGKTIVDEEDYEVIHGCMKSVMNNQKAAELLMTGKAEGSVFWNDFESNVICKARPDFVSNTQGYIVDLKTTQDASDFEFARTIAKYFYHMQAAFYLDGISTASGQRFERFFFIAVETSAPYACKVYSLDYGSIEKGRELYQKALNTYAKCFKEDIWPGYEEKIETIAIPHWSF